MISQVTNEVTLHDEVFVDQSKTVVKVFVQLNFEKNLVQSYQIFDSAQTFVNKIINEDYKNLQKVKEQIRNDLKKIHEFETLKQKGFQSYVRV